MKIWSWIYKPKNLQTFSLILLNIIQDLKSCFHKWESWRHRLDVDCKKSYIVQYLFLMYKPCNQHLYTGLERNMYMWQLSTSYPQQHSSYCWSYFVWWWYFTPFCSCPTSPAGRRRMLVTHNIRVTGLSGYYQVICSPASHW